MPHEHWQEYAKAVAAFVTTAIPSVIATAGVLDLTTTKWWEVFWILGAGVLGGVSGGAVVYHVPNKPVGSSGLQPPAPPASGPPAGEDHR